MKLFAIVLLDVVVIVVAFVILACGPVQVTYEPRPRDHEADQGTPHSLFKVEPLE